MVVFEKFPEQNLNFGFSKCAFLPLLEKSRLGSGLQTGREEGNLLFSPSGNQVSAGKEKTP